MSLYPARFDYHLPTTIDETVAMLHDLEGAKVLAGGASLIPLMRLRLAAPRHLVDIGRLPGLDAIDERDGVLVIGSLVRQSALAASPAAARFGALRDAAAVIADPQIRNIGTVGGNLAHGDPANDDPAIMLALGASYEVVGPGGRRTIGAGAFHVDMLQTSLEPDELLVEIRVPIPPTRSGSAYVKFERQVGDLATAAAAAAVTLDGAGRVAAIAVGFTNLAPVPVRSDTVESALLGTIPDVAMLEKAVRHIPELDPWDDLRASTEVKRSMATAAARRSLSAALARARGTSG